MDSHDLTLARRMRSLPSSCVREIMRATEGQQVISFAGGLPRPDLLPLEAVRRATDRVLVREGTRALQYSSTEGDSRLRELVAERLLAPRGVRVCPEQVLITTGSQQGLDLLGKILLEPGSRVALECPSYLAAIQAFGLYEPEYRSVPMDDDGIDTTTLAALAAKEHPSFLYAIPDFQNPTGRLYSRQRRAETVEVILRNRLLLVEDAPYSHLHYDECPGPMLAAGCPELALSMGTVSKVLAPGFRVGWVSGPKAWIEQLTRAKQASDLCTGSFVQRVVAELLGELDLDAHLERLRTAYRTQRDAMLAALEHAMPAGVVWTRPAGGMFLWVTLPEGLSARDLLSRCMPLGVVFAPGDSFSPDGDCGNSLRLNFTHASPGEIDQGIQIVAEALMEMA